MRSHIAFVAALALVALGAATTSDVAAAPGWGSSTETAAAAATLSLRIDGADVGVVRSTTAGEGAKKTITIQTTDPTQTLLNVVRAYLDGKGPPKRSLVLSTGAVIEKASDARLVDVRFPSYAGGSTDLALVFEAPTITTSPSLRTASDRARPSTLKLASFRLALGDLPTTEATRLDSLLVKAKEGTPVPQGLAFDVPSKDAPALLAWSKKPTPREGAIEYVSPTGEMLLNVKIASCTPNGATNQGSAVKIDGPVTHVAVACTRVKTL